MTEVIGLIKQQTLADVDADDKLDESLENLRVPYRFCSDEYAGGSSYCHRFDEGADVYETVRNKINRRGVSPAGGEPARSAPAGAPPGAIWIGRWTRSTS